MQKISHVYLSVDRNYYSVPHRYIGHYVEVQYNNETVEVFYNFQRIAKHQRSFRPGNYATIGDHMPSSHQVYNQWNPIYFEQRAAIVGPYAQEYIRKLIGQYNYPELGYKQAQGILSFVKTYGTSRVENACKRALSHHKSSYQTIHNILKNRLDTLEEGLEQQTFHIPVHENLRDTSIYR
ncbi:transposase [Sphingobacterium sp. DR205]|uniref:Mu transposase domain-containing protein n=1 Tax=Sphingobacterium sp. DR205 TaxID=2713573 RepID=UPI0013E4C4B8|nr:transposase [Sphingobacterium sp. DR205]QIH35978.1 transposase [Sphingobacterium sp. DR205]